ncbi:Imm1 family immunity protein [Streptomyces mirabilis]|uniref:Imm1 family immunity protein n=1 Tax=Streptomyces mirabilis TaxID=68239 RepID=UPI00367ABAF2
MGVSSGLSTAAVPGWGEVYESVWISDNPQPPCFDPRVVSDPGYPLFHDPASALPLERVRAALEEFCRAGTGERPECISWAPGDANGQRLDRAPMVEQVEDPVIDWGQPLVVSRFQPGVAANDLDGLTERRSSWQHGVTIKVHRAARSLACLSTLSRSTCSAAPCAT